MSSTYSLRFRLNYQAPGDNLNLWGAILNAGVFQLLEDAIAKRVAITVSGTRALSTADGATDEARCAFVDITGGTGGVLTIPSVEKIYLFRNSADDIVTITTGAGATVLIDPTDMIYVVCDGSNVRTPGFGGLSLKAWVSAQVIGVTGTLPGAVGNEGKALVVQSGVWAPKTLQVADVQDFEDATRQRALVYSIIFGR